MFKILSILVAATFLSSCTTLENPKQLTPNKSKTTCIGVMCDDRNNQMQAALMARTLSDNTKIIPIKTSSIKSNSAATIKKIVVESTPIKNELENPNSMVAIEPASGRSSSINEVSISSSSEETNPSFVKESESNSSASDNSVVKVVQPEVIDANNHSATSGVNLSLTSNYNYLIAGSAFGFNISFNPKDYIPINIVNFDLKRYWTQPSWLTSQEWYWIKTGLATLLITTTILALITPLFLPKSVVEYQRRERVNNNLATAKSRVQPRSTEW